MANPRYTPSRAEVDAMHRDYTERTDLSPRQVAALHYVCYTTMLRYFRLYNLPLTRLPGKPKRCTPEQMQRIRLEYLAGTTQKQLAARYGVSRHTIASYLGDMRRPHGSHRFSREQAEAIHRECTSNLNRSMLDIALDHDTCPDTLNRTFDLYGLPRPRRRQHKRNTAHDDTVRTLRGRGMTHREISALTGITRSRVARILQREE